MDMVLHECKDNTNQGRLVYKFCGVAASDVVLKTGLGLKAIFLRVLTKSVMVLTLDGLKDLKNCGLKTKKVLKS